MSASAASFLGPWSTFYIMTGTSAATLVGLMFVVITLVTRVEEAARSQDGLSTFSTPTVLHFCWALLISAILTAPWRALVYPSVSIGMAGFYGIVHLVRVMFLSRRLMQRTQETPYVPDLEDFIWYTILPLVAYCAVFAGGIALAMLPGVALFVLAGGVLLLIFIGIRDAWGVVTFLAVWSGRGPSK